MVAAATYLPEDYRRLRLRCQLIAKAIYLQLRLRYQLIARAIYLAQPRYQLIARAIYLAQPRFTKPRLRPPPGCSTA